MSASITLRFNVQGTQLDAVRDCESEVFLAAFGNTRQQLEEEYGPYEDQSVFTGVFDQSGEAVGSCRVIRPGGAGLKTLNDVGQAPWFVDGPRSARAAGVDPTRAWDLATLGVRAGYRSHSFMVGIALYYGLFRSAYVNGVPAIVSIMDDHMRRTLGAFDVECPPLPGTATGEYLGSAKSTPVYYLAEMLDVQRRRNPDAYRLLSLGVGLDGVSLPSDDDLRLSSRVVPVPQRVVAA
jgi:hypothetical protein